MDFLTKYAQQLKDLCLQANTPGRIGLIIITAVCLSAVVGVGIWASRPEYMVLASSLAPEETTAITDKLENESIPYKLNFSGSTIMVPFAAVFPPRPRPLGCRRCQRQAPR